MLEWVKEVQQTLLDILQVCPHAGLSTATVSVDMDPLPESIGCKMCLICIVDFEDSDDMQVLPYAGTIWLRLSLLSLHLLHEKLIMMFFTDFQVLETLIAGEGGELMEHHVSQLLCFLWYLQFAQCCHATIRPSFSSLL
jgi:hypothetical protein